jgi:hypothetical protein
MKLRQVSLIFLVLASAVGSAVTVWGAPGDAVTAEEIIDRVVQAATNSPTGARLHYQFSRSVLTEYFDDKGVINDRGTRGYKVQPQGGRLVPSLIEVNGNSPTESEKAEWSKRAVESEKRREFRLNREVLSHFTFQLVTNEVINGRNCYLLAFQPRKDPKGKDNLMARILGRLHGKIWIDQEDYQFAKADIHLMERVSIWAGVAGVLEQCDLVIERRRLEPGFWLTSGSYIELRGRKVLSNFHFRAWEECKEFMRLNEGEQIADAPGR